MFHQLFFAPYQMLFCRILAGKILGVHMEFHICFLSELHNVIPFLVIGLLNGSVMSLHTFSY